ncbi:MAG TPA: glycosyltransferase family 39 protein [Candidatus Polarisedimenticolia bacterium]|nr:glycosyltransferase family 39 protein [Candidatus Polarisedimenticolia bacterium]
MDRERIFPWILLALTASLYLTSLSGRDLWEPNEPTYAEATREMAARGDWLLPTVNGEIYPDKPPLLFWGIGLASLPEGRVTETTARIPSALAGMSLVLGIYFLSRRILGPWGAFMSAAILAVSNLFVEQARYVQPDMLLSLGTGIGILSLFRVVDGGAPRAGWVLISAAGLALGILVKGPVALALPVLVIAAGLVLERRGFRQSGRLCLVGLLALSAPALYYLDLVRRHGFATMREFILRSNIERFVAGFDNLEPWWFYLKHFPVDLVPMTFLLPAAAFFRPRDRERRLAHRSFWVWLGVCLVFFSLSTSKRPVYLLPAFPAAALLCGSLLDGLTEWRPGRLVKRWVALGQGAALALLGSAGIAAPFLARRQAPELLRTALMLTLTGVAGCIIGFWQLVRERFIAVQAILVGAMAALWLVSIFWVYPAANQFNSPRPFAEEIHRMVPSDAPLKTFGLYQWRAGYPFYARREMPRLSETSGVERFLESDKRVFCVVPEEGLASLKANIPTPIYLLAEGRAGHRRDCLISNRPPG